MIYINGRLTRLSTLKNICEATYGTKITNLFIKRTWINRWR